MIHTILVIAVIIYFYISHKQNKKNEQNKITRSEWEESSKIKIEYPENKLTYEEWESLEDYNEPLKLTSSEWAEQILKEKLTREEYLDDVDSEIASCCTSFMCD